MLRTRNVAAQVWPYRVYNPSTSSWGATKTVSGSPELAEQSVEGHNPFWPQFNGRFDCGNDWYHTRNVNLYPVTQYLYYQDAFRGFDGTVVIFGPRVPPSGEPYPITQLSNAQLDANGTTAIAHVEPTQPTFGGTNAVAELLREGMPDIPAIRNWREQTLHYKDVPEGYLNNEFGWKLLIKDIKDFARSVMRKHQILMSYHKGSSHLFRTRYTILENDSTSNWYSGDMLVAPTDLGVFAKQGNEIWTRHQKHWFSGAFKYYVPMHGSQVDNLHRWYSDARKLSGLELTPEVLWNAAPWSWAVDWFSNVGDVMHNVSAMGRDGLVLVYGYSMAEFRRTRIRNGTVPASPNRYKSFYLQSDLEDVVHQRRHATPYGFGFDMSSLTPRQAAILAAIGITR